MTELQIQENGIVKVVRLQGEEGGFVPSENPEDEGEDDKDDDDDNKDESQAEDDAARPPLRRMMTLADVIRKATSAKVADFLQVTMFVLFKFSWMSFIRKKEILRIINNRLLPRNGLFSFKKDYRILPNKRPGHF